MTPSWQLAATMHFNYGLPSEELCKMGQCIAIMSTLLRTAICDGMSMMVLGQPDRNALEGRCSNKNNMSLVVSLPVKVPLALHLNEPLLIVCFELDKTATSMSVLRVSNPPSTVKTRIKSLLNILDDMLLID